MELLSRLEFVIAYNRKIMESVDYDQSRAEGLVTFYDDKQGVSVWNPLIDVSGRFDVDPIEEYGEGNIKEMIYKFETM
jgi:hypothetical protein